MIQANFFICVFAMISNDIEIHCILCKKLCQRLDPLLNFWYDYEIKICTQMSLLKIALMFQEMFKEYH
jgi:hypothetical protein